MKLTFERDGTVVIAVLAGRIGGNNVSQIEQQFATEIASTDRALIMDLHDVTFSSSAGLRFFMIIAKNMEKQGGRMVLCELTPPIRQVFSIIGIDQVIAIAESRETAREIM